MTDLFGESDLALFERRIDTWLDRMREQNPAIEAVDRGEAGGPLRWYVRMRGEQKDVTTVWLTLGQRTLRYETYVMPSPEEHQGELYEHLLRRNDALVGAHWSIGIEDAIFLRGELELVALDEDELDRILGTLYAQVEQTFRSLLRLGFASRFRGT